MSKKPYWGYRAVLKKIDLPGEDYLVLEEVHYDSDDKPIARDGGRAFQVTAEEGVEGMISMLELAIRHLHERGILEDPWPNN